MSSHASEGAQQPAAPEGETPAGESAAAPAETAAAADAGQAEALPADTGPAAPDTAATADAGPVTMVLDPELEAGAGTQYGDGRSAAGPIDGEPPTGESHGEPFEREPFEPFRRNQFHEDSFHEHSFHEDSFHGEQFGEEPEPVSKLAIAALVTGVVALVPLAVMFGIAALAGIGRTGRRGRGMALAALFASAAWLIVGGAFGTVAALTHGFHKPVTIRYRESAVFKLREGNCIDSPNGQLVSVLPCSSPHEAEVFGTFSLPAAAWPGTATVARAARTGCASRLTGYINPQLAISLSQSYVYPNRVAWAAGTRTVVCEVHASSGQLTGSVRGAT